MRTVKNESNSSRAPQPFARLRMRSAILQAPRRAKADIVRICLTFMGVRNQRVRLAFVSVRGENLVEIELPRTQLKSWVNWMLDQTEGEVPGDWTDAELQEGVCKSLFSLREAYERASPELQAHWRREHPTLLLHQIPGHKHLLKQRDRH